MISRRMKKISSWVFWLIETILCYILTCYLLELFSRIYKQSLWTALGDSILLILWIALMILIYVVVEYVAEKIFGEGDSTSDNYAMNIVLKIIGGVFEVVAVIAFFLNSNVSIKSINSVGTFFYMLYPCFGWCFIGEAFTVFAERMYPTSSRKERKEEKTT